VAVGWLWSRCPRAPPVIGGYIFTCTPLGLWLLGSSSQAPCSSLHVHAPQRTATCTATRAHPLCRRRRFCCRHQNCLRCCCHRHSASPSTRQTPAYCCCHPCASTVSHVSWPGELSGSDRASVSLVTSDDSRAAAFGFVRMTTRVRTHAELSPVALASPRTVQGVGGVGAR